MTKIERIESVISSYRGMLDDLLTDLAVIGLKGEEYKINFPIGTITIKMG